MEQSQHTGLFIVIDGVDGSGKATQAALLRKHLEAAGYSVNTLAFPRYDEPSSYFVRQYLEGMYGDADNVSPYTASLFYALDRYQAAQQIRDALAAGHIVIADRFTASSMGHHGTKFAHAEERRGYFIWLDNLEFQTLEIPRPDKTFILRVPAEVSQRLRDQRGRKADIHEAHPNHMNRAVDAFDDLLQLFPKDFSRIDCVRSGNLMSREQIHDLLWQAVKPLLPARPHSNEAEDEETESNEPETTSIPRPYISVPVGGISHLLAQQLENEPGLYFVEQSNNTNGSRPYIIPENLEPLVKTKYVGAMDKIFGLHTEMVQNLVTHLRKNSPDNSEAALYAQAKEVLQLVLPVASKINLTFSADIHELKDILKRLHGSQSHEARNVANHILAEARKSFPDLEDSANKPAKSTKSHNAQIHGNHSGATETIKLVGVWPRNELDLLPYMLYESSSASLEELSQELANWSIDRKTQAFQTYIADMPGKALEQMHYTWELLCDYATFRDLQRSQLFEYIDAQATTPRYGYDVPEIIEDAGLTESFEQCFDVSAQLYSVLQEAGFTDEASYATLFGHRARFKLTHTAADIPDILKVFALAPTTQNAMHQALVEHHPLLAQIAPPKK